MFITSCYTVFTLPKVYLKTEDRQTDKHQTERGTDGQAGRQKDKYTDRHAGIRKTNRQASDIEGQTCRQKDKQTDRQRDIQTCRH